ncbi:MAG TPA: NAD(P)H-binding protein [Candidatus Krumholzibacteria bacterium]|nr:NAD(P)H-binding protein [Candidatus Krumholzibacteria bacterium]
MKILVTGGTGFVGTALRRELKSQGHDVRLLVRAQSVGKVDPREGFEIITGDVLDSHACLRAVDGIDAVIHLVGIRREHPDDGLTYEAMHTEAAYTIFDAARRAHVQRAVYLSALGARPDAQAGYHRTKFESEEILKKTGMRWTIFRPSVVFGIGDEFHPLVADLVHRSVVPLINGGKTLMQPVSLANVVGPLARTVTMPETQGSIYELGGPERVTFVDIMYKVARVYGVWPNTISVSGMLAKPMVKFAQRFRSFPLTLEELYMLLEDNVCDTSMFTSTFGVTLDTYMDKVESLCPKLEERAA